MERVQIACVRYLNTLPLIHGLEKLPTAELVLTVPSRIAGMVRAHEADVGLVSLVDAADGTIPLALLPSGMIGCDGPTLTVRLFSSVPCHQIDEVHADTDSRTSVVLCQLLLHRLHAIRPRIIPFNTRTPSPGPGSAAWPRTILLIGDKVVTDPPPADRFPHMLDLGQAWKDLTGLPFVYAAWACRADEADNTRVGTAGVLLDRQRRRNTLRLDWIADRFASDHRWPADLARRYLGALLRYDLGPREREGAERFLADAAALGLIAAPKIAWGEAGLPQAGAVLPA